MRQASWSEDLSHPPTSRRDLEKQRAAQLDAGEFIETLIVPFEEALAMVRDGRITDAKTVAALLWVQAWGR